MLSRKKLLEALQAHPDLAPFLGPLFVDEQGGHFYFSAKELENPSSLREVLEGFSVSEGFAQGDLRAIASLWSRWYFGVILPPLLTAFTAYPAIPRLEVLWLAHDFKPYRLQWSESIEPFSAKSSDSICRAIESIITGFVPMVQALTTVSKVSPKVFWSNLGNLTEYWLGQLQGVTAAHQPVIALFNQYFQKTTLMDGEPNPLFEPVRYLDLCLDEPHTVRVRKICCLYYLLPGTELCSNCPRIKLSARHVST